jgi:type I restriction enzyme S subunit
MGTFVAKYQPIIAQIGKHEKQNKELAALRDFLLPLLMNGQVTVSTGQQ